MRSGIIIDSRDIISFKGIKDSFTLAQLGHTKAYLYHYLARVQNSVNKNLPRFR